MYHFEARHLEILRYNLFGKIFRFCKYMNTLGNFVKSVFAHFLAKFLILRKTNNVIGIF